MENYIIIATLALIIISAILYIVKQKKKVINASDVRTRENARVAARKTDLCTYFTLGKYKIA